MPEIEALARKANEVGLNDLLGEFIYRITNEGKDTAGTQIGTYTNERYIEMREEAGAEVGYVNLQFSGALMRSIDIGTTGDSTAIGITNPERARISEYLEAYYKKPIFVPGTKEREMAIQTAQDYLTDGLVQIIRGWSQ